MKLDDSLDISSTHSNMHYRILDWHESLEENSSMTTVINDDINPDLILGTDVVCALFFFLKCIVTIIYRHMTPLLFRHWSKPSKLLFIILLGPLSLQLHCEMKKPGITFSVVLPVRSNV